MKRLELSLLRLKFSQKVRRKFRHFDLLRILRALLACFRTTEIERISSELKSYADAVRGGPSKLLCLNQYACELEFYLERRLKNRIRHIFKNEKLST
jgi:hypothetical protein